MASYTKRGNAWRVQVKKNGTRKSGTFSTKAEAKAWAAKQEIELVSGHVPKKKVYLVDLFDRYSDEIAPQHKGERWEKIRLKSIGRVLGNHTVKDLVASDILATWKAERLKVVSPGTVRREMGLVNQVFEVALKEWRLIDVNPITGIKRPKEPKPRDRLISAEELAAMWEKLRYDESCEITMKIQEVGLALDLALETAMRSGEILTYLNNKTGKVAHLVNTKNNTDRDVPMSKRARELVKRIPDGGFSVSSSSLTTLFGKARTKCGYPNSKNGGFRFHDSRANALTALSKKLDVLALAKMVGHLDTKSLMIYYRESAEDIADRL